MFFLTKRCRNKNVYNMQTNMFFITSTGKEIE